MGEGSSAKKLNVALVVVAVAALVLSAAGLGVALVSTAKPAGPAPQDRTARVVIRGLDPEDQAAANLTGTEGQHLFFGGTIIVNKGDTVNITLVNLDDHIHGLEIEGYDAANITRVNPSEQRSVTFTADHAGVFLIRCNIPFDPVDPTKCGADHKLIRGYLIVQ